jgi:acetyl esterase
MMKMMEGKPKRERTVEAIRAGMRRQTRFVNLFPLRLGRIEDLLIPLEDRQLPARLYLPKAQASSASPLPLLVYFHGGGFAICDLDTHDSLCRHLCKTSNYAILSVDYRLAPEHRFPAAVDDGLATVRWLAKEGAARLGIDPLRIVVGGDSAGGNLATVTAIRARDEGGCKLAGQILIYPVTDYYEPGTPSILHCADGYGLTREDLIWYWGQYLHDPSLAASPLASPLKTPDLTGLPPALIITAAYDPLCDEGIAYAKRLDQAGCSLLHLHYPKMIHGFVSMIGLLPDAKEAIHKIASWLHSL